MSEVTGPISTVGAADALNAIVSEAGQAIPGQESVEGAELSAEEQAKQAEELAAKAKEEEKKPEIDRFSQKFAALSRKEKAIRQREEAITKRAAEMEAKLKTEQEEVAKYKNLPERLKKEPLKVMEELGLSFQQLAEMVLNDGKPTQDMIMSEYEKKFQSKIEELEKKLTEKEQKEEQERLDKTLNNFMAELTNFVKSEEKYELIRANDAVDLVYEVIEAHFDKSGNVLNYQEACDYVEDYLLEEAKRHLELSKIKGLIAPKVEPQPAKKTSSVTLSNSNSAQVPSSGTRKLSEEESLAAAAKLIRWDD